MRGLVACFLPACFSLVVFTALVCPPSAYTDEPLPQREKEKSRGNVTLHYSAESDPLSDALLEYAVRANAYLTRLFAPPEPVHQSVFWLAKRDWRHRPATYGFPYANKRDAYLAAADVDLPTQLGLIADAMDIERGGPAIERMADLLGLPQGATPADVLKQLKESKEFFVTLTAWFIMPHELTHGMCNALEYPSTPRWFYEGIAQWAAFKMVSDFHSPREAQLCYEYYQLLWDRATPGLKVKDFLAVDKIGAGGLDIANYAWYHAGLLKMFRDLEAMKGSDLLPDLVREVRKFGPDKRQVTHAAMVSAFSAAVGRDLKLWFASNWRIE